MTTLATMAEKRRAQRAAGAALGAWRTGQGWTQAELAGKLGLHMNTVARMERGELPITPRTRGQLHTLGHSWPHPAPSALPLP